MPRKETVRRVENNTYKSEEYIFSVMWSDEDEVFIARVVEFPSLATHGDTMEEALKEIRDLVGYVLEDLVESGEEVPVPLSRRNFSGKLNLRMSKHLHRQLASEAEREGVSLNQWINTKLASR